MRLDLEETIEHLRNVVSAPLQVCDLRFSSSGLRTSLIGLYPTYYDVAEA